MPELFLLRDLPRYEMLQEKAQRYPDLDVGAVEATLVLLRVASDIIEGFGEQFARNGTSQGRHLVMMMLDRPCVPDGMLPSELAEAIGVTRATVTGLLDGLERDNLISRQTHPDDRRAVRIQLTGKGRDFLARMLPDHYRRIAGLMAHLSDEERRLLIALLGKVALGQNAMHDPAWQPHAELQPQLLETLN